MPGMSISAAFDEGRLAASVRIACVRQVGGRGKYNHVRTVSWDLPGDKGDRESLAPCPSAGRHGDTSGLGRLKAGGKRRKSVKAS